MKLTPIELKKYLKNLVQNQVEISTMIWGPPGIGKSSIVAQIAQEYNIDFIDVRLSQLAPTDLRGLPVAVQKTDSEKQEGISTWYPPEFLPRQGKGILFLDELNMAPPAIQGIAQQLILDRQVGAYQVPPGWFIWAAGNRKEDKASVFDMPAPLANRFLHLQVEADFDSFKEYALVKGFHEQIIAFLNFRTTLLHQIDKQNYAWPSPRTWEMASKLHAYNLNIAPAVGEGTAAEFNAYIKVYQDLPNLDNILQGKGEKIPFPKEPSTRYATTIGLTVRVNNYDQGYHALNWLKNQTTSEWVQLYFVDLSKRLRAKNQMGVLAKMVQQDPNLKKFLMDFAEDLL